MESRAILVLGMHRCGTSAVTRCLGFLGAELGTELLPPDSANPSGYWEDLRILELNQRLAEALGEKSDHWWAHFLPLEIPLDAPPVLALLSEAVETIRARFRPYPWWAFKDPRTLRAFPFWETALQQAGVEIREVVVVRHPLACARSIGLRDRVPEDRSTLIWASHYLGYWPQIAARPWVAIDYDRLLEDPEPELRRLSERLGLPWNPQALKEATAFLAPSLRHARGRPEEFANHPNLSPLVSEAFAALEDLCVDRDPQSAGARLLALHTELHRLVPLLRVLEAESSRAAKLGVLWAQQEKSRTWRLFRRLREVERSFRRFRRRQSGATSNG